MSRTRTTASGQRRAAPSGRASLVAGSLGSVRLPVSAALAVVLSSICLGSTFLTGGWFFPAVFAVVLSMGACEVARRTSAPRAAVPLAGLAVLLVYLTLRYTRDQALLGLVPTRDSLQSLRLLFADGRDDISRFAAPIAVTPGIELLVVSGVGLIGVVVDTLAVTLRRAALAGLPLLVLYTVPVSVAPDGVNWVAFALGGIGYLTLLLAEARERGSRWGRPMRYTTPRANWRPEADTAPLAQVGRRVGAAALGLALVVPAVLPSIDASTFGWGGSGFGAGRGGGKQVRVVNPIIDLGANLRQGKNDVVIKYTGKADYLRLASLDNFNGDKWGPTQFKVRNSKNDVTDGFTRPPGLTADVKAHSRSYSLEVFNLESTWLPLPYAPTKVSDISGRWVYDPVTFNVIPTNGAPDSFGYKVRTLAIEPSASQLRAAGTPPDTLSQFTQLPADTPEAIGNTAKTWTKGLPDAFDQAVAIQTRLRGFQYTTEVEDTIGDANGVRAIEAFLTSHQGYCVHFASTMAVMARYLGIPARVAVVFTAGEAQKDGSHLVRTHDLHAWPELYFSGVGWVRFEPTPDGDRTRPPAFTAGGLPGDGGVAGGGPGTSGNGAGGTGTNPRQVDNRLGNPRLVDGQDAGSGKAPVPQAAAPVAANKPFPVLPVVVGAVVLLLLFVPFAARSVVRRRRFSRATTPALLAKAAWDELRDTLLDHAYTWPDADAPRRGAEHVAADRGLTGEPAAALFRLARAAERARYAPDLGEVGNLRGDVDAVRRELSAQSGRGARLRARFLPRSTRALSDALSERFADLLDAVDGLTARLTPRRSG